MHFSMCPPLMAQMPKTCLTCPSSTLLLNVPKQAAPKSSWPAKTLKWVANAPRCSSSSPRTVTWASVGQTSIHSSARNVPIFLISILLSTASLMPTKKPCSTPATPSSARTTCPCANCSMRCVKPIAAPWVRSSCTRPNWAKSVGGKKSWKAFAASPTSIRTKRKLSSKT